MQYRPLISVVVPVYNVEPQMLTACIQSVQNQTYDNWELCLVDDCSTDSRVRETLQQYEKIKNIKIKYRTENGHISRATNDGIAINILVLTVLEILVLTSRILPSVNDATTLGSIDEDMADATP